MVKGINSSKKYYFIWLSVFLVLFFGLMIGMTVWANKAPDLFNNKTVKLICLYALPYLIATLPMGITIRRRFMHWYAYVPTDELDLDFNIFSIVAVIRAGSRLFKCLFLSFFNSLLLLFYLIVAIIIGIFFTPYFIISGIVLIVKKKI